jgi:hypothetical protein
MFPPHKEMAVAESISWIQHMSFGLVNLGVSCDHSVSMPNLKCSNSFQILKFLETGERGALITLVWVLSSMAYSNFSGM